MELDERKIKILHAIIKNYLETGEPVGSRTISKDTDLNLSSATIRNEMSDLEEMGYILQPHTSAGRIPSDKGYRFYVDSLMTDKIQEIDDMKDQLEKKADHIEHLLQQAAKMLAANTNYASVVTKPKVKHKKVKFIQLTSMDADQILFVLVLEGNIVKNRMIHTKEPVDQEMALKLNLMFNTFLQGLDMTEINLSLIQKMKEESGPYAGLVGDILDAVAEIVSDVDNVEIYTSGATNILKYPELSDSQKASELLGTFEEKHLLTELLSEKNSTDDGSHQIQVYIGEESPLDSMKDCSIVTATYEVSDGVFGKIGIVGPKRMDYEKVVTTIRAMMSDLDDIFKNKEERR
ncbi:MAG: heat-inducible transcriptional repressor HrcA [Clostridiales bacterium]|nr:heat-inducible transcriptional repressor HrcA [Clostridiales bacterium]